MASAPASDRITVWRNARLATMSERRPGIGSDLRRRRGRPRRPHRLCRPRGRPSCRVAARCRDRRLRRPADHARPDRLPHPSGPRRQPRQRIRDAACRRDLRGGGEGRRRHRLVGQGAQGRERGRACPPVTAAARRADCRRGHNDRDQVGLRARPRERGEVAARRAAAGNRTERYGTHQLPRRACAAAGSQGRQGRLYRPRRQRDAAGDRRGWLLPTRSTAFARASPSRPSRSPACSTRRRRSACR